MVEVVVVAEHWVEKIFVTFHLAFAPFAFADQVKEHDFFHQLSEQFALFLVGLQKDRGVVEQDIHLLFCHL